SLYHFLVLFCQSCINHPHILSFPTRRSSDLSALDHVELVVDFVGAINIDRHFLDLVQVEHFNSQIAHAPRTALGTGHGRAKAVRSEEHTSELQSRENLVCRLLLEKKKKKKNK